MEERIVEADNEYMAAANLALGSREPLTILGVRMAVGRLPGSKNTGRTRAPKTTTVKRKAPAKKRKAVKKRTPAEQRAIDKRMEGVRAGKKKAARR